MLIALLSLIQAAPQITANSVPSKQAVERLERAVRLPAGALPLNRYTRFYTQADVDGRPTIVGQMIVMELVRDYFRREKKPMPPPIVRGLERDILPAFDGGCAVLMVRFDLQRDAAPEIVCNPPGPSAN